MDDDANATLSMEDIIRAAIAREVESFDFYSRAARDARDPDLHALFLELAAMEQEHRERLKARLEECETRHWLEEAISC